jgi:cysteine-rich repeat protein
MAVAKRRFLFGPLLLVSGAIGCGRTDFVTGPDAGMGGYPGQPSLADAAPVPDLVPPHGPDLAPGFRGLTCGNGWGDPGEECDDGNRLPGEGCSGNCTVEPGFKCVAPGQRCTPICGDGLVVGTESCDDLNQTSGDGCSYLCLTEPCWTCSGDVCRPQPPAVDGGNCHGLPADACGDGILQEAEECDQGYSKNTVVYGTLTACSPSCTRPRYCGDGYVDTDYGEHCDQGDWNGRGLCTPDCRMFMP